jgi:hypothetical protein
MAYIESILEPGERVRFRGDLHWSVYILAGLLLGTSLFLAGLSFYEWGAGSPPNLLIILLAVLIVIVSVGALALTVCLSLVIILANGSPPGAGTVFPLAPLAVGSEHFMAA